MLLICEPDSGKYLRFNNQFGTNTWTTCLQSLDLTDYQVKETRTMQHSRTKMHFSWAYTGLCQKDMENPTHNISFEKHFITLLKTLCDK